MVWRCPPFLMSVILSPKREQDSLFCLLEDSALLPRILPDSANVLWENPSMCLCPLKFPICYSSNVRLLWDLMIFLYPARSSASVCAQIKQIASNIKLASCTHLISGQFFSLWNFSLCKFCCFCNSSMPLKYYLKFICFLK